MKNRPNDQTRQALFDQMIEILRHDSPWAFGIYSETLMLTQQWLTPYKTNAFGQGTLKYTGVNVSLRNDMRRSWNQPILWPIALFFLILALILVPFMLAYYKKQQQLATRDRL